MHAAIVISHAMSLNKEFPNKNFALLHNHILIMQNAGIVRVYIFPLFHKEADILNEWETSEIKLNAQEVI